MLHHVKTMAEILTVLMVVRIVVLTAVRLTAVHAAWEAERAEDLVVEDTAEAVSMAVEAVVAEEDVNCFL